MDLEQGTYPSSSVMSWKMRRRKNCSNLNLCLCSSQQLQSSTRFEGNKPLLWNMDCKKFCWNILFEINFVRRCEARISFQPTFVWIVYSLHYKSFLIFLRHFKCSSPRTVQTRKLQNMKDKDRREHEKGLKHGCQRMYQPCL